MKHTQGEWKVDERASLRVHHDYRTIASCGGYVASENAEEAEANAKLIAAAPDLLKAVDGITRWLRQAAEVLELKANEDGKSSFLQPKLNWYADKIEAAIKKATE